jgi:hypothetical protein
VARLADRVVETLAAGGRSDGPARNAWLAWESIGRTVIDMYLDVLDRSRQRG